MKQAQRLTKKRIVIDADFFDHLLNCMANQPYIHEQKPRDRRKSQKVIDAAYHQARELQRLKGLSRNRIPAAMVDLVAALAIRSTREKK